MSDATVQDWYKDAVIYQLHLKSFYDGNNDGTGDFPGLMQKLDYIAELGVTAVWMLPFYPSPRRDDGYDIADYTSVHADYGTMDDVRAFIDAAHARNIRVIAELVINHTSDQHPWFQRARHAAPGSPEREFYVWSDTDTKYAGTRIIFVDTETSNWTFDPVAGAYYWHRFYSHQPDLNFDNPAVLAEVLSVMRFWLALGIDGLRLDAVPYLIEREGTNNENLAETHGILRQIRAELDRVAPGKMLLAEANQWPEDAQQYFGNGDECHMSFHFPLMPRMYMAIAREDRFPITDIMRQTPEIPANCQWAIFLRNHDELTLEMVTSSERDYLWNAYAADKRARINLGIRRRLAPLLERDRRRIELMNGLLLSMPGTPVIYYGDEIGMGDNIFLGDRDGVRTPMQWSMDRNGGFSRADPARLVLPPIMDANYGFQAVNVEAQAADPHSLLNWTRRMLAVRGRHRCFGRGVQRFLYPSNRKVLAYIREHEGEAVLCIANLSRVAQAVELELGAYVGRVPVDLVGGAVFPPVGQLNYLFTLAPYGFFWFLLSDKAALPAWHIEPPEPLPDFETIVLLHGTAAEAAERGRITLSRTALPAYLPKRRWYGSKTEQLSTATVAYTAALPGTDQAVLAEVTVELPGRTENYVLPMAIVWDDEASGALPQQLALARVRRVARVGVLTDGFASDPFAQAMMAAFADGTAVAITGGMLTFRRTAAFTPPPEGIRRLAAEQSNSSMILGDAVVLKLVRKVLAGVHPEAEMTGYLTEHGFTNTAPPLGELVRVDTDGTPHTLALAQGFVRNQGDGWGWTREFLKRAANELAITDDLPDAGDQFLAYDVFARAVGTRLAELHRTLAAPTDHPDFAPQPADADVQAEWAAGAREQLELALAMLEGHDAAEAQWLLNHRVALLDLPARLASQGAGALNTRVHGDFHLGQVLVVEADAYIIDFEGEPARTMEQRRARSCPMRDVAGLLRSFDYAAAAAATETATATAPDATNPASIRRQTVLSDFRIRAAAEFLAAYRAVLHDGPAWVPPDAEQPLLDLFLIEKAAYEIRYEAENRPTWLHIPLDGLHSIVRRLIEGPDL